VEDLPLFIKLLAKAFSLDSHDFTRLMSNGNCVQLACASISICGAQQSDTVKFHTLKVVLSLVNKNGLVYNDRCVVVDKTHNYVIQKWTQAVHSAIWLLSFFMSQMKSLLPCPISNIGMAFICLLYCQMVLATTSWVVAATKTLEN
jgi:hypothetical protein